MARAVLVVALAGAVLGFVAGCSRPNVATIDGLQPKYTGNTVLENLAQDMNMAGDDWLLFWGMEEPSTLSSDQTFRLRY